MNNATKARQQVEQSHVDDYTTAQFHTIPDNWRQANGYVARRINSHTHLIQSQPLLQSHIAHDSIWAPTPGTAQTFDVLVGHDTDPIHHVAPGALARFDVGQNTTVVEQLSLMDNVTRLFHVLSQHYRAIAMELTTHRDNIGSKKVEQALTSTFHIVLQFCDLLTSTMAREETSNDMNKALAVFFNTTISVMTVKTIIDLYDLVLYTFDGSLWPSVNITREAGSRRQQERQSDKGVLQSGDHVHDMDRVLKICGQMETMDFHVVHLEVACRRFRDLAWRTSYAVSPQVMTPDGSTTSAASPQIYASQNEALDRLLNDATSTRQEIRRLRSKVQGPASTAQ